MAPEFNPAPFSDYASTPCCAVTRDGKRCGRRWRTAMSCIWEWDPVTGRGSDGPHVVLCARHRRSYELATQRAKYDRKPVPRIRVVGGWFGPYNTYNYGGAVWSSATGWRPAARWWRHVRRGMLFGHDRRDAL